jgi:hypothetical protein
MYRYLQTDRQTVYHKPFTNIQECSNCISSSKSSDWFLFTNKIHFHIYYAYEGNQPYRHLWAGCLDKMWEPRLPTILWTSTSCYRDSFNSYEGNRVGSVGIATAIRAARGVQARLPEGASDCFFLPHNARNGSVVHPVSYTMGTTASLSGVKRQRREASHSPPSIAEVRNGGVYLHSPIRLHGIVLD